ncbi:MAG TPA: methyltransferase domain-containing protein [Candidatus Udaeobacter sp.]|nr:methyltransferase domain-containing protein [Candidatus Udaeobacter sp.]
MKRSFDAAVLEMMDREQLVSSELERDLERLRQLNRWFGSYRLVLGFIRDWIKPAEKLRVVDLATGSGDIPRLIVDYTRKISGKVEIDALDRQPATLEIARRLSVDYPEISYHEGDVLEWTPTEAYDITLCNLALHHFSNEDAVRLLRRCHQVSKRFVLVSDLRRGFPLVAGVYLLTALIFREPMTRYDARLSTIRAFSFSEMSDLALRAGWQNFGHKRFRFGRQAIWLEAGQASRVRVDRARKNPQIPRLRSE